MRKVLCTILTFVLVVSLFAPLSFASQDDYNWVVQEVERTNLEIEKMIDKAINDVELIRYLSNQENGNNYNTMNEKALENMIANVIKRLINDTDKISAEMVNKAASVGIEVICEYVEVEIDGKLILIDPLRVVGF